MAHNYSFKFTEKAENDLDGILQYIAEELCNPTAAKELYQKIFESIDTVLSFPETGQVVVNEFLTDKKIRRLLVDNYIIYYKADIENSVIYIIRIVFGKRDFNEIAKSL